jgi:predicted permease
MRDDLRFAWRRLVSAPVFTITAVMTLALAIGANTAIFSIADAVLFRPLPYADPASLHVVQLLERETGRRFTFVDYRYVRAIDQHHSGLSDVGLVDSAPRLVYTDASGSTYVPVVAVSANYFDLLGTRAAHGRLITASDGPAAGRVAVLPYALWQSRFGGRQDIVGRPLTIGTKTFDIVGILPREFFFPSNMAGPPAVVTVMPPLSEGQAGGTFHPIVRRAAHVTREQAQHELDALALAAVPPKSDRTTTPFLEDARSVLFPTGRPIMLWLLAASGLILLLGCVNLSAMLMARARNRQRDTGVRLALGASRGRLIRELACEALLIGSLSAALALTVTYLAFDLLLQQVPPIAYGRAPVEVNQRVLMFGSVLALIAAMVVATLPAWRQTQMDAQDLLQWRGRGDNRRFGRFMVAAQVAMAVVLVFGAAVTAKAFIDVLRVPLGFSPDHVAVIGVAPNLRGYAQQDFYMRAIETLSRRSDVVAAGATMSLPLSLMAPDQGVAIDGVPSRSLGIYHVLPGYFEALSIPLRRGRLLNAADVTGRAPVAILSESAARVLSPNRDPLGTTVATPSGGTFTVVGVVADTLRSFGQDSMQPVYVLPHDGIRFMSLVVRMRESNASVLADLKRQIAALAPGTPVGAGWWSDALAAMTAYRNPRFQTLVLGSFAGLALVLTATGILGVVSFLVATRTREMGIRIAVGATPASLVALMLRQTLVPIAIGIAIGLVATRWAGRLAEAQLFQVDAHDPATLCAAALTVLATAARAAYMPARRAGRVNPITVLRVD